MCARLSYAFQCTLKFPYCIVSWVHSGSQFTSTKSLAFTTHLEVVQLGQQQQCIVDLFPRIRGSGAGEQRVISVNEFVEERGCHLRANAAVNHSEQQSDISDDTRRSARRQKCRVQYDLRQRWRQIRTGALAVHRLYALHDARQITFTQSMQKHTNTVSSITACRRATGCHKW